ncbi:SPFH domain-containing protein [Calycomorphotria hydatis]|uniref:SPFH domain / Band 7 family protein n=1 Tax=Calycomorphotria hydatis TaxID=2528027 RepID=A0A517T4E3_9PLAN|nr:SPFH domain-containing protein [Calycomorphotria hydatis]QDT63250.1 SPFH domain / Band 7 family protein [Calycomorphotria hydatis]
MSNEQTRSSFLRSSLISLGVFAVLAIVIGWGLFEWMVNRIYVPEGSSLMLQYKGPPVPLLPGSRPGAAPEEFAEVDENGNPLELGVLEELRGPGRHFYCPFWWERTLVQDVVVEAGEVGVATSKMGGDLPRGEFLVDGDLGETKFKGTLRKVFGPGRYRVNPYAYQFNIIQTEQLQSGNQVKHAGWVEIPTGYVGVVTNLAPNPERGTKAGTQNEVLQPGLYPINPKEQQIDIVEIGYREKSIVANLKTLPNGQLAVDVSGEPVILNDDSGISFPSNDGFPIDMDFTAVWGIMPDQAAEVIRKFGNVQAVESKVVVPQIESICRNMGSKLGAVDLLVGTSRQQFQADTSDSFRSVLEEKNVTLLYGLVRHIYIPQEVRQPIQQSFIADELKLTREQEILTAKTEAMLREAERKVELESQRILAETDKKVAKVLAEGQKTAEETHGETAKMVAAIDRKTADLEAQATVLRGEAIAKAQQVQEEAKADKFRLAVAAFGSGMAYNQWVFASGLPTNIKLNLLYAGEGTFWTDLKGFSETMLGRQVRESQSK